MCKKNSDKVENTLLNELIVEYLNIRISKEFFIKNQQYESAGKMRDKERILMSKVCKLLPDDPHYVSGDNYEESSSHKARQLIIANHLSKIFGYEIEDGKIDAITLRDFKLRLIL